MVGTKVKIRKRVDRPSGKSEFVYELGTVMVVIPPNSDPILCGVELKKSYRKRVLWSRPKSNVLIPAFESDVEYI